MNKITKAELARRFNVNQSRINALLSGKNPKLIETEDGLIDLDNPYNQKYIEERRISVPKYTGIPLQDEQIDDEGSDEETNRPDAHLKDPLYAQKVLKYEKENELLSIRIRKEKKELVETEVLNRILMQSYEIFNNMLMESPHNIIEQIRDIILTDSYSNNEDLELLLKTNRDIYIKGLEKTRVAIKAFYDST